MPRQDRGKARLQRDTFSRSPRPWCGTPWTRRTTTLRCSSYDQAFSLYQGDILPGDLFHDWAHGHREHIRKIHAEMLTHAASLTEAQHDRPRTFTYYGKMFSLDPCNEMACRWLMAWYLAAGQRGDAVRLYERCQLALQKELDIEPDDQTKKMYRSIIGG